MAFGEHSEGVPAYPGACRAGVQRSCRECSPGPGSCRVEPPATSTSSLAAVLPLPLKTQSASVFPGSRLVRIPMRKTCEREAALAVCGPKRAGSAVQPGQRFSRHCLVPRTEAAKFCWFMKKSLVLRTALAANAKQYVCKGGTRNGAGHAEENLFRGRIGAKPMWWKGTGGGAGGGLGELAGSRGSARVAASSARRS